jgi:triosephosphate isomerase
MKNENKKLIIANWKMNPLTLREAGALVDAVDHAGSGVDVVVAPPFVFIEYVSSIISTGTKLGAQDVCWEDPNKGGAYTGEVSASMLKKMGVEYVIVGHSERRQYLQETDALIGKKLAMTIKAGMAAVLCVGEPTEIRKKGMAEVKKYIKKQITGALNDLPLTSLRANKLSIAYEPIWAIGTGKAATPEDALEVITYIKSILTTNYHIPTTRVLYGGSVNAKNILEFVGRNEIDGALIGGASVNPKEFNKMLKII